MHSSPAIEALADVIDAGGLVDRRSSGIVLVSGGADSACSAASLVALCGPDRVYALHCNFSLRPDSNLDEQAARRLCAKLRIDLHVERPVLGEGNVQARARAARYRAAEELRRRLGADWVATGHTRTDLAETLIYRLAVSPGTRPLLGLPPRNGSIVRPLHAISREETRAVAEEAGLPFHDDPTNASPRYARNRIRNEVMPVLEQIGPEIERNIAATHAELHEEAELLGSLVLESLKAAGVGEAATDIDAEEVGRMTPGLRRLVLRELAGRAADRPIAMSRARAGEIARLCGPGEGGEVELGGGMSAICEAGLVRFERRAEAAPLPEAVELSVPGSSRFGEWELRAELLPEGTIPVGPSVATLDAARLGRRLEVRCWRAGDRIRPLGMEGTKSLQDLFTDAGVPRSLRRRLPVLVVDGRVAWVAGVAVSEEFRIRPGAAAVRIHAEPGSPSAPVEPGRGAGVSATSPV